MHFLRKIIFHFPCIEKISNFREKEMPSFLVIQERSHSSAIFFFFGKTIFSEHLKKKSYFHVLLLRKIISFFISISIFRGKQQCFFIKTSCYFALFKYLILSIQGLVFNTELITNICFEQFSM